MEFWTIWWVWLCCALALTIIEIFVSGFVFLGIAAGAALMALIAALPLNLGIETSLAIFAGLSLISWIVLKRVFKPADDQTRVVHEDINK